MSNNRRKICYVTGTRAEFGLMQTTLDAIRQHPQLQLQLIATGMHLSMKHGRTVNVILDAGYKVNAFVPWRTPSSQNDLSLTTAEAQVRIARKIVKLNPDIVMVCGDRVEAFAAASAAHLGGRIVAHVHGGDRALGQVDDALRHAITKLSHLHFGATKQSADRIYNLGEDRFRIHCVGTPGVDGIRSIAKQHQSEPVKALIVLHPDSPDAVRQFDQAKRLLQITRSVCGDSMVAVYPNNDPGWQGIARCLEQEAKAHSIRIEKDLPREQFIGLLASARVLVGNSSAGIIEAASLRTPVVNIGDRQLGRERSGNVIDMPWDDAKIRSAIRSAIKKRFSGVNVYGGGSAGKRIGKILSDVVLDDKLRKKLIRY